MTAPQQQPERSYCKHPDAETQRSCSGLCRGPGPSDDCEYFQHEQPPAPQQPQEYSEQDVDYLIKEITEALDTGYDSFAEDEQIIKDHYLYWKDAIRSRPAPASSTAPAHKFTCWRGECKLHDDCIHSYQQEYPPCVDACAIQAARAAQEDVLENICHNCGGLADGAEQCNSCYVKSLRGERR